MGEQQSNRETVLVIDDDQSVRRGLYWALSSTFHVLEAGTRREAEDVLQREDIQVVVTDLHLPPHIDDTSEGLAMIRAARAIQPAKQVVAITGSNSRKAALEAVKHGAYGFLEKPLDAAEILHVVNQAARIQRLEHENARLRNEISSTGFSHLIGTSRSLAEVLKHARAVAITSATVLLIGENGTGKEMLARAIHDESPRASGPFVAVSCAALPETLIESELFGHEKGSFTSATHSRKGRFELADGGTLFLDEISELSQAVQVKLLRVLQERSFERVGGSKTISVDIRLIAASNRDLATEVESGRFRQDLFYRLNVVPLVIPPLRNRTEDIATLAGHFASKTAAKYGKDNPRLDAKLIESLQEYGWPGNVRELENLMERLVVLTSGGELGVEFLPESMQRILTVGGDEDTLEGAMMSAKRRVVLSALESVGGNRVAAAKRLGISRSYLHRLINDFGIR